MTLWTSSEAASATGGKAVGDWSVSGISIDTRSLKPGDLFVALKDVRDGHDFVEAAFAAGAGAALVSHRPDTVPGDAPLLLVDDVQAGLEALGRAGRARCHAKVIAVTGSVGKTSTKEMLKAVLERQGRTHAAVASYNNHWGVPLTLARMPQDTEFAVIEIGMNHPGEIAPLSVMAAPDVALITTVAAAHLEAFESIDGIAHEKAAIFDGLSQTGVAIFNADVDTAAILQAKAQKIGDHRGFGASGRAGRLLSVRLHDDTTVVEAEIAGQAQLFKLASAGRHFAMNGLATLLCVDAVGGDVTLAARDLALWTPPAGRGARERVVLDKVEHELSVDLIDDAYNANPTSLRAALEVLAAASVRNDLGRISKGRRIAVLGDMLELGADEIALHRAVAEDPSLEKLTLVHCVGPRMRHLYEALPEHLRGYWVDTAPELAARAHDIVDAGDVIMVKGSLGSRVGQIVDAIRKLGHAVGQQE